MKKRITVVTLLVIAASLVAWGSTAFTAVDGRATNVVTTNRIEMSVKETGDFAATEETGVYELADHLLPNQSADKKVTLENTGAEPFYARVHVDIEVKDAKGKPMDDAYDAYILLDHQTGSWVAGADGWYYYNGQVGKNETTSPVFTKVTLDKTAPNAMQKAKVTITVRAQAVQAKNNPVPAGGVTAITGWPN